tara:strand:+ start:4168 stop:4569 length:402 start_codon:yes stop_codon:yes gene_type:complete
MDIIKPTIPRLDSRRGFQTKYKQLLEKHMYECVIFPEQNNFKVGERVLIKPKNYTDKNSVSGKIVSFVSDGTLYIKTNSWDSGRNYHPLLVKSLKTDNSNRYIPSLHSITFSRLLENHKTAITELYDKYNPLL